MIAVHGRGGVKLMHQCPLAVVASVAALGVPSGEVPAKETGQMSRVASDAQIK
jgi:hypothetical protein